jgi:NAD(P)-dependent dehydrogenase (short-subunit alcohol dehydrogenase family)
MEGWKMARMTGKVALVVGGAKGIGLATARVLAEEGASVILTGRMQQEVAAAAESIGSSALGLVADAASQVDLEQVVRETQRLHGRIDALVLNAGLSEPATLIEETAEHFDRHFAVNVRGALFGIQAALPVLSEGSAPMPRLKRHCAPMRAVGQPNLRLVASGSTSSRPDRRTRT